MGDQRMLAGLKFTITIEEESWTYYFAIVPIVRISFGVMSMGTPQSIFKKSLF